MLRSSIFLSLGFKTWINFRKERSSMNMLRLLPLFALMSFCLLSAQAQDSTTVSGFSFLPDELFPTSTLDSSKKKKLRKASDLKIYNEEGERLKQEGLMEMMEDDATEPIAFTDSSLSIKALVYVEKENGQGNGDQKEEAKRSKKSEQEIPRSFEIPLLNGTTHRVDRGKEGDSILVINFWFTACKPCKMEIPELNELVREFEEEPVRFQAITHEKASKIRSFLKEEEFLYEQGIEGKELYRSFGIKSFPAHLIIDRKGELRLFRTGYSKERVEGIANELQELLENGER